MKKLKIVKLKEAEDKRGQYCTSMKWNSTTGKKNSSESGMVAHSCNTST
jgi:hypothetical protein